MEHRIVFHIGMQKTGSTALQKWLSDNSKLLKENGWCYPDIEQDLTGICPILLEGTSNGNLFFDVNRNIDYSPDRWQYIFEKISLYLENYNVIISDEALWTAAKAKFWKKVKERIGRNIQVVIYLRRQDLFIESIWGQRIRGRFETRDFETYIQNEPYEFELHYSKVLEMIESCVGSENLVVRVYEPEQLYGDNKRIEEDFLHVLGIEESVGTFKDIPHVNNSLDINCIRLKREYNYVANAFGFYEKKYRECFEKTSMLWGESNPKRYIAPNERHDFLSAYAKDNEYVAKRWLKRPNGRLFAEPQDDCLNNNVIKTSDSNEMYMRLLFSMFIETYRDIARMRSEYKRLAEKILFEKASDRPIVLFAAGKRCHDFLKECTLPIAFVIDNDSFKVGKRIMGHDIRTFQSIDNMHNIFIVVTPDNTTEIELQIEEAGGVFGEDYCLLKDYWRSE